MTKKVPVTIKAKGKRLVKTSAIFSKLNFYSMTSKGDPLWVYSR